VERYRFSGEICGFGTSGGVRVVVGRWPRSPFGPFADVMLEDSTGNRVLIAPDERVAVFIAATYTFDEVVVAPVVAERTDDRLLVVAGALAADVELGGRPVLGHLLRAIPRSVSAATWWATVTDPFARLLMPGVRTRGRTAGGRREWYAAHDLRDVAAITARWQGRDLGELCDIDPPVRFGFGSTPRRASIASITTTVAVATAPRST
jgi:hypothetical protein